ncbi:hypothetical protein CBR_g1018 [Chara braunii]|uniref:CCHC-type domain-containing protein n=1 Tax=Chara braunii TaxID=69332 RepID=A0A388KCX9_CHABU|nr:hypothetical protein CBR_g1018 [Chara braunii]|eukprot:GBG67899.1 hypothetical protein CBR_g1018 [Chara braunii]
MAAPSRDGCFNCGEVGHWSRECPYPRRIQLRPPVATGANAEPILVLPAAGKQQPAAAPSTFATSTYPAQPRSGWWNRNQQILDKCNAFVSRAEQKEREERAAKERVRRQREKDEEAARVKKEREDFENQMTQRLESRLAPMYDAIMGKGASKPGDGTAADEVNRLRRENEAMRAKYGITEQMPSTNLVDRLQKENNELRKFGEDLKTRLEGDLAALKWEIRDLKEHHESADRSTLTKQIDDLRAEMDALRKKNEESEEVAHLWRNEALRPGNKRGSINITTPASEGRTAETKRIEAEKELVKLRDQMGKLSTDPAEAATPRGAGTNLKEKMDEAVNTGLRSGRQGRVKMTPGRLPRDGSARKANDRFAFLIEERKRLKALKKGGLELLCKEVGIKYKTIDSTVDELAEINVDKAFGGCSSSRENEDEGPEQDGRVFPRTDGHFCFRSSQVDFVPQFLKNSRNIPGPLRSASRQHLAQQISASFEQVPFLPKLSTEMFGRVLLDACLNRNRVVDGFASSGPDSVSYWRDRFANLVRVPIDHNVGDTLVCCPVIYRHGMDKLFLDNQGFVKCDSEKKVRDLPAARFRDEGLTTLGKWDREGSLGEAYVVPKHKDVAKWRPICPTHSECGVRASKTAVQAINRMLWDLPSAINFNLKSMSDLAAAVGGVNKDLKKGEQLLSSAFDIKEMFCNLPHAAIIHTVQWVVDFWSMRGCSGILVKKRGKGAKLKKGGKQEGWITIEFDMLIKFVIFDLECTFVRACGRVLQQKVGIPMGKSSSPALACLLCAYNEFRFLSSLRCDRKLVHGIRMVDDVSLLVRYVDNDLESVAVAQSILTKFRSCYDHHLVLEQTSGGDCWDFLGCVLKVLDWPLGVQCVALHKNQRNFGEEKLRFQNLQDFQSFSSNQQKMAVIGSCLHRGKAYTTMSGMEVAFLFTLKIELRKRGFPDEYFDIALMTALSEIANQHLRELERVRKEQDAVIKKINKIHSKLCLTDPEKAERFGEKLWVRLRDFYEEAKELAMKEDYISGLCIKEVESLSHTSVAPPPAAPPPPPPPPPPPHPSAPPSTLPLPIPSSTLPSSAANQSSSVHHHPQQANSQPSRKKSAAAMAASASSESKRKKLKMVMTASASASAAAGGGGGGGGGGEMGETVMMGGSGGVVPRLASPSSLSPRVTGTSTTYHHPQHYHPQHYQQQQHHHHHHHHHPQQHQQQPSSSSMEQAAIAVGDQVAARVTDDNAEKDDWIVVKVTKYDRESNRYEVIDEEPGDDEESGQRKYKLAASCIIPFPKKGGDQSQTAEFYTGAQVLAVYPGTTALYKAAVVRKRKGDDYLLEFDDDEEEGVDGLPQRSVPFYHTVPLPEGHRQ